MIMASSLLMIVSVLTWTQNHNWTYTLLNSIWYVEMEAAGRSETEQSEWNVRMEIKLI